MITERDEIKCRTAVEMVDASTLEPRTKADLKEAIEEAKLNLNGRTMEERVLSIAQNQFDTTRFLAEIIIQFKRVADKADKADKTEDGTDKPAGKKTMIKVALKWISENQFFVLLIAIIIAIQGGNIGAYIAKMLGM